MIKQLKKIKHALEAFMWIIYYKFVNIFSDKESYKVLWDVNEKNFGDILTPFILEALTDKKIVRIQKSQYYLHEHYFVIGSILQRATKFTKVWGSGFIDENCQCIQAPLHVYAVRGPKSREKLLNAGVQCPEIYGDPALLLPKIYFPKKIEKKYKLGIIPHYIDKKISWLDKIKNNEEIKVIDIQVDNPISFIDELLSCEKIASSSLHGIITADAYGIPSVWLEFSENVKGNGFKFIDYFLSVGRKDKKPLVVTDNIGLTEIYDSFYDYKINIDLDKLMDACPFFARKYLKKIQ